jgi:hypothetical protein
MAGPVPGVWSGAAAVALGAGLALVLPAAAARRRGRERIMQVLATPTLLVPHSMGEASARLTP